MDKSMAVMDFPDSKEAKCLQALNELKELKSLLWETQQKIKRIEREVKKNFMDTALDMDCVRVDYVTLERRLRNL